MRRVENAQRCRDGGSVRAPQVSCPPVKAGYVATRRLAETLRMASKAAGVADVYVSRVALRQGPFRGEGAALLGFLRNGSLAAASASADVDAAADAGGAPALSNAGEDVGLLRALPGREL